MEKIAVCLLATCLCAPAWADDAFVSGTYAAQVDQWSSTWMIRVEGSEITGSSQWSCCPGHRVDMLSGKREGARVTLRRDCSGQGQPGTCSQTYVGEIRGGQVVGTWSGTGGQGNWKLTLAPAAAPATPPPPQVQPALSSGKYKVQADRWTSTWTLTITGSEVSGISEWTCCPGPRTDALRGRLEGTRLVLQRDCSGQGHSGPCSQTYVGEVKNGSVTGTWSGTGGSGSWTLSPQ